jgi:hypothetical protein
MNKIYGFTVLCSDTYSSNTLLVGSMLISRATQQSELSLSLMLRPTISRPVCLGAKHPSAAYDQIFITCVTVTVLFLYGALSDERSGLSFVYAAGSCQRSLFRVRVPWDLRPYFTVSDLRLPFSSPPTTRRVEVFDPASTGCTPEQSELNESVKNRHFASSLLQHDLNYRAT